jgi:hypothetical protein
VRWIWPPIYVGFFCLLSWQLGGDGSPDTRIYHLYNGYAAVTGGRPQDLAAAGLQTYFFPGVDALYYRLFMGLNEHPGLLRLILGLPYALAAWLTFLIGVVLVPRDWPGREFFAGAFALFGVTGAASLSTLGTMMSDVLPGLPMLAALALWLRYKGGYLPLVAVGALAGISVGAKLTLVPLLVGLLATMLILGLRRPGIALRSVLTCGSAALVAALIVAGPWWLLNWQKFGNPILPAYNDVFRSDWVSAGRWSDDRFKPVGLWRVLVYPSVWAVEESHSAIELNMHDPRMLMGLAALVALLVRWRVEPAARRLALLILIAYVLWEIQFSIYRYLALMECLAGVLMLAAVAAWIPRRAASVATLGLLVLAGAAAASTKYPWWDRTRPGWLLALTVELPPIPNDSMVLLLDRAAYSYAVPFLPAGVTVVGANTNLVGPGYEGRLQTTIEDRVKGWSGPIWGFENPVSQPGAADTILAYYGLRRGKPCQEIGGNIGEPHTTICQLERLEANGQKPPS